MAIASFGTLFLFFGLAKTKNTENLTAFGTSNVFYKES
jgi:hypothetical protein